MLTKKELKFLEKLQHVFNSDGDYWSQDSSGTVRIYFEKVK